MIIYCDNLIQIRARCLFNTMTNIYDLVIIYTFMNLLIIMTIQYFNREKHFKLLQGDAPICCFSLLNYYNILTPIVAQIVKFPYLLRKVFYSIVVHLEEILKEQNQQKLS